MRTLGRKILKIKKRISTLKIYILGLLSHCYGFELLFFEVTFKKSQVKKNVLVVPKMLCMDS